MARLLFIILLLTLFLTPTHALKIQLNNSQNNHEFKGTLSWYAEGNATPVNITSLCEGDSGDFFLPAGGSKSISCRLNNGDIPGAKAPLKIYARVDTDDGKVWKSKKYLYLLFKDVSEATCDDPRAERRFLSCRDGEIDVGSVRGLFRCCIKEEEEYIIGSCEEYSLDDCLNDPDGVGHCKVYGETCITEKTYRIFVVPVIGESTQEFEYEVCGAKKKKYYELSFEPDYESAAFEVFLEKMPCWFNAEVSQLEPIFVEEGRFFETTGSFYRVIEEHAVRAGGREYDLLISTIDSARWESADSRGTIRGLAYVSRNTILIFDNGRSDSDIASTLTHEFGHMLAGLCDEGYNIVASERCDSGFETCQGGGCSGGECPESCPTKFRCCPNYPEENSRMCSRDACGTGCTDGPDFAPSSREAVLESYLKNGYC